MAGQLFHFDVSPMDLVVRATVVYLAIVILLRIGGKRQLGQMGATEFVAILLISNAVQNSMNGGDNSLIGGLVLASVLIFLSALISYLTYRSSTFSLFFEGSPTLLIHNGHLIRKHLMHERLSESEVKILLRKQGVHDISQVKTAILESDGTFSITRYEEAPMTYTEAPPSRQ